MKKDRCTCEEIGLPEAKVLFGSFLSLVDFEV